MFTLSSSDRNKYLAFDENILKVEDKLNHMAASIFLDVDDCRQLASALLHGAESQILRQVINDWILDEVAMQGLRELDGLEEVDGEQSVIKIII